MSSFALFSSHGTDSSQITSASHSHSQSLSRSQSKSRVPLSLLSTERSRSPDLLSPTTLAGATTPRSGAVLNLRSRRESDSELGLERGRLQLQLELEFDDSTKPNRENGGEYESPAKPADSMSTHLCTILREAFGLKTNPDMNVDTETSASAVAPCLRDALDTSRGVIAVIQTILQCIDQNAVIRVPQNVKTTSSQSFKPSPYMYDEEACSSILDTLSHSISTTAGAGVTRQVETQNYVSVSLANIPPPPRRTPIYVAASRMLTSLQQRSQCQSLQNVCRCQCRPLVNLGKEYPRISSCGDSVGFTSSSLRRANLLSQYSEEKLLMLQAFEFKKLVVAVFFRDSVSLSSLPIYRSSLTDQYYRHRQLVEQKEKQKQRRKSHSRSHFELDSVDSKAQESRESMESLIDLDVELPLGVPHPLATLRTKDIVLGFTHRPGISITTKKVFLYNVTSGQEPLGCIPASSRQQNFIASALALVDMEHPQSQHRAKLPPTSKGPTPIKPYSGQFSPAPDTISHVQTRSPAQEQASSHSLLSQSQGSSTTPGDGSGGTVSTLSSISTTTHPASSLSMVTSENNGAIGTKSVSKTLLSSGFDNSPGVALSADPLAPGSSNSVSTASTSLVQTTGLSSILAEDSGTSAGGVNRVEDSLVSDVKTLSTSTGDGNSNTIRTDTLSVVSTSTPSLAPGSTAEESLLGTSGSIGSADGIKSDPSAGMALSLSPHTEVGTANMNFGSTSANNTSGASINIDLQRSRGDKKDEETALENNHASHQASAPGDFIHVSTSDMSSGPGKLHSHAQASESLITTFTTATAAVLSSPTSEDTFAAFGYQGFQGYQGYSPATGSAYGATTSPPEAQGSPGSSTALPLPAPTSPTIRTTIKDKTISSHTNRIEWISLQHDSVVHPHSCFGFQIQWLCALGPTVFSEVRQLQRLARSMQLHLLQVPTSQVFLPSGSADPLSQTTPLPLRSDAHRLHIIQWAMSLGGFTLSYVPISYQSAGDELIEQLSPSLLTSIVGAGSDECDEAIEEEKEEESGYISNRKVMLKMLRKEIVADGEIGVETRAAAEAKAKAGGQEGNQMKPTFATRDSDVVKNTLEEYFEQDDDILSSGIDKVQNGDLYDILKDEDAFFNEEYYQMLEKHALLEQKLLRQLKRTASQGTSLSTKKNPLPEQSHMSNKTKLDSSSSISSATSTLAASSASGSFSSFPSPSSPQAAANGANQMSLVHHSGSCLIRFTSFYAIFVPNFNSSNTSDLVKLTHESHRVFRNLHHVWTNYHPTPY